MGKAFPAIFPLLGWMRTSARAPEKTSNNSLHRPKHFFKPLRLYQCSQAKVLGMGNEKPRGGSRGACDTQSFRPLVQEVEVSSGRDYSPAACVSTRYPPRVVLFG